jgi:hypothetical protein
MATEEEILSLWGKPADAKQRANILRFYSAAVEKGKQEGIAALEGELTNDAAIDAALKNFGWGGKKAATITTRAVIRETIRIALRNLKK